MPRIETQNTKVRTTPSHHSRKKSASVKTLRKSPCDTPGCGNKVAVWLWEGQYGRIEQWRSGYLEAVTIPETAPELLAMPGVRPHNRPSEPGTRRFRFLRSLIKVVGQTLRVPRGAVAEIESWVK
jgi:hypothetical protein